MNETEGRIREVGTLAFRLGITAFGGPAAHIAMLRTEVVERRKWVTDQQFLDLLGATNLIPGPNSTEMVIHIGYLRAGLPGLLVAGAGFILPAILSVLALAWGYVRFGSNPQAGWLLYGIKPVIIAVIFQALIGLGRKAVQGPLTLIVGLLAVGLYFAGLDELGLMFGGGVAVMLIKNFRRLGRLGEHGLPALALTALVRLAPAAPAFSLSLLFLNFLKIGAVLYGSGYVLLAFLQADFVERLGWLTSEQLVDAIAIGQLTPGPVFTTATFVGFILGGFPGAVVATAGIFAPSFFFVLLSNRFIPRMRRSPWLGALLDGVNVSALGLMAGVTWQLTRAAFVDPPTLLLGLGAAVMLFRYRVNPAWLVLGGGLAGWISSLL